MQSLVQQMNSAKYRMVIAPAGFHNKDDQYTQMVQASKPSTYHGILLSLESCTYRGINPLVMNTGNKPIYALFSPPEALLVKAWGSVVLNLISKCFLSKNLCMYATRTVCLSQHRSMYRSATWGGGCQRKRVETNLQISVGRLATGRPFTVLRLARQHGISNQQPRQTLSITEF